MLDVDYAFITFHSKTARLYIAIMIPLCDARAADAI